MTYAPSTDFVGLWRAVTGGARKAEMPGKDFAAAALARLGLLNVTFSGTPPTSNQAKTAWFLPASPSYSAEGVLYLWNSVSSAYEVATPKLFKDYINAQ